MIGGKQKGFTLFEVIVVLGIFSIISVVIVAIFTNVSASQRREAISQKALSDTRSVIATIQQAVQTYRIDYDFYKGNEYFDADGAGGNPAIKVSCDSIYSDSDYPYDECDLRGSNAAGIHVLALINDNGERIRYWWHKEWSVASPYGGEGKLYVCANNPLVAPRSCELQHDNSNFVNTTPTSLALPELSFFISPASDPTNRGDRLPCDSADSEDIKCQCYKNNNAQIGTDPAAVCSPSTSNYCAEDLKCGIPDVQPSVTTTMVIEGQGLAVGRVQVPIQFTTSSRSYGR